MLTKRLLTFPTVCIGLCACILFTVLSGVAVRQTVSSSVDTVAQTPVILIDPGHGGADGGTIGQDGTLEKDINLLIALPLADMLTVCGYPVQTTRNTDTSIHTQGNTLREQKNSDLKNRSAMSQQALLTVSIHQNQFPVAKYYGTQVFYATNAPDSQRLAEAIQEQVVGFLQPDNTRKCKKGSSDIYLLSRATRPCVIVECGFLSNPDECAKLNTPQYREQMAFSILTGILRYDP